LEKSLSYKPEDRMSINGMKYLADVFIIQNKGKATASTASSFDNISPAFQNSQQPQPHRKASVESQLAPAALTSTNIPVRESFKRPDSKGKFTSTIMYT
jgi:hypothetical protein